MLKYDFDKNKNRLMCLFEERIDSLNSPNAETDISQKIEEISSNQEIKIEDMNLVFDLVKVDFVSSSFMRVCIIFAKRFKKENFKIINTKLMIKKTYKIAGFDKIMNIE